MNDAGNLRLMKICAVVIVLAVFVVVTCSDDDDPVRPTDMNPTSVVYKEDGYFIKNSKGEIIGTGTVATSSSPYWPDNDYKIMGYTIGNIDDDAQREVVIFANHSTYYPSQIVSIESNGRIISRYWNVGHSYCLMCYDINDDDVLEILIGATNNDQVPGLYVPSVFALDARTMTGEAPPRNGSVGTGAEIWYTFVNQSVSEGIRELTVSGDTLICGAGTGGGTYKVNLTDGSLY